MEKLKNILNSISEQVKYQKTIFKKNQRLTKYYQSKKDDNRNSLAKVFDYSLLRILTFFLLFIFSYVKIKNLYVSLVFSTILFIILHVLAVRLRKQDLENIKEEKRWNLGSQRVYNEIMNMNIEEVKEYIILIFTRQGFNNFDFLKCENRHILLKSVYKEEEIMILFNIYNNNFDVEIKQIKEFQYVLEKDNIKKGILVTTSGFTKDCYEYVQQAEKLSNLILVNKETLIRLIEHNGMFPDEEQIDEIIETKLSKKEKNWNKYKAEVLSSKKIKKYVLLSIYLFITSWYTPFTIYYVIVASIILGIAFISFILNTKTKLKIHEESIDLEKLLNDL